MSVNNIEEEDDEIFTLIDIDNLSWAIPLIEWVEYAIKYTLITKKVTEIMFENFSNYTAYRCQHKIINSVILEGINEEDKLFIKSTNGIKTTLRTAEQRRERTRIVKHINYLFTKLGKEIYGDLFITPLKSPTTEMDIPTSGKKSGKKNDELPKKELKQEFNEKVI
jgi:hypothetical protein